MSEKKIKKGSAEYFFYCGVGGILSCGITHTAVTPLDLVKCNAQVNKTVFPDTVTGFRKIFSGAEDVRALGFQKKGMAGLLRGWGPTAIGYSAQGLCKFGFYEFFSYLYKGFLTPEQQFQYRDLVYVASSASAEFIADVALCPFEAVKVRMQTQPAFAPTGRATMSKIIAEEGMGNLFAGLGPLWARQVPYTIIKFVAFEKIAEAVYGMCSKPKAEMNKAEQMGVIFTSGYLAGVLCGAVSHPADTMVSKINNVEMEGSLMQKMKHIYTGTAEAPGIGFAGLWTGFLPRVVMIGTLTGLQWFIYGAFKAAVGLPTPGASAKDKHK